MFWRVLWKLLRSNGGRLLVALIALSSGAAVISALLNLDLDIERKLTQEFRALGPNLVISPGSDIRRIEAGAQTPSLMDESAAFAQLERVPSSNFVAQAPYLYVVARSASTPVVVAGTWLDELPRLNPTWKLKGDWVASRADDSRCLIGRNVARQFQIAPGATLDFDYLSRKKKLTVAGIVDAGGAEDSQVFVNLPVAQNLAGLQGRVELVQMSVSGTAKSIAAYAEQLAKLLRGYDVRPIRQVTEAEGGLLNRIQLLVLSMVVLILVLTAVCVLATMAALAMERRIDVGLMKALGGSISRVVGIFLAEIGLLGAIGGVLGCIGGVALSRWMGQQAFGTAITPRWEIFVLTIAAMVGVALAGALPLRLLGRVKPAAILRGE